MKRRWGYFGILAIVVVLVSIGATAILSAPPTTDFQSGDAYAVNSCLPQQWTYVQAFDAERTFYFDISPDEASQVYNLRGRPVQWLGYSSDWENGGWQEERQGVIVGFGGINLDEITGVAWFEFYDADDQLISVMQVSHDEFYDNLHTVWVFSPNADGEWVYASDGRAEDYHGAAFEYNSPYSSDGGRVMCAWFVESTDIPVLGRLQ